MFLCFLLQGTWQMVFNYQLLDSLPPFSIILPVSSVLSKNIKNSPQKAPNCLFLLSGTMGSKPFINVRRREQKDGFREEVFLLASAEANHCLVYFWPKQSQRECLPVSQWVPVYPGRHVQVYPFIRSLQVPPFRQGVDRHSSMSEKKNKEMSVFVFPRSLHKTCFYK